MSPPTSTIEDVAARIPDAPPGVTPTRQEVAAIAARVGETFKPQRIVLFGSRAYGVPKPGSDVDLMVVMERADRSDDTERRIRDAIGYGRPGRWQVLVRSPAEIRRGLAENDFFIRDVMTKGITLYEGREAMDTNEEGTNEANSASSGLKQATLDWLEAAEEDYKLAIRLRGDPQPYLNHIGFLAQQAIEKSLKALLQEEEIEFPRTHDLVVLAGLCGTLLPELFALEPTLAQIAGWAIDPRYPGLRLNESQVDEAIRAMTTVRRAVRAVLGLPTT